MSKQTKKTLLFCTSYAPDVLSWQQRYVRWLTHHRPLAQDDCIICLVDDASPYLLSEQTIATYSQVDQIPLAVKRPFVFRYENRLGRAGILSYPGWWRSFLGSLTIAQALGCSKIIHVESDAYILNKKMFKAMQQLESGWWAAWCSSHDFPETAVQVICSDQFGAMRLMSQMDPKSFDHMNAERILPITGLLRQFSGDRYSEFRQQLPKNADFAVQVTPEQKIWIR